MRIATFTINPAIDLTIRLSALKVGSVNRVIESRSDAGGKGVNVASFLADSGLDVTASGFLGEDNQGIFTKLFSRKKIKDEFIRVAGETRINVKLVEDGSKETTDINSSGIAPTTDQIATLMEKVNDLCDRIDLFVLSGNLPNGCPVDLYARMVDLIKQNGRIVILDTSGEALREALKFKPDVIKPNHIELGEHLGRSLKSLEDVVAAGQEMLELGIGLVIISMGAEGAVFMKSGETVIAKPPAVEVLSTVAAGDAMVAGTISGMERSLGLDEMAKLATAFSVRTVTDLNRDLTNGGLIEEYAKKVDIIRLNKVGN